MRADESLEIRFLRASLPEEAQRPDGARGARRGSSSRPSIGTRAATAAGASTANRGKAASPRAGSACPLSRRSPGSPEGARPESAASRRRSSRETLGRTWQSALSPRAGDIAYMPASEGRLCLAAAIDAFSRKAVGRSMSERIAEKVARSTRWSRRSAGRIRQTTAASSSMTTKARSTPRAPSRDAWTRMA